MTHQRPRLFLDVDGVLNAESPASEDVKTATVNENHGAAYVSTYLITFSPTVVAGIEALRAEFGLELFWLSTWLSGEGMLDQLTAVLGGLRGGRRLAMPRRKLGGYLPQTWKRELLLADIAREPAPFIWVDDVEVPLHGEFVHAAFETPSLVIAPNPAIGLTAEHLSAMRSFLEGLT